MDHSFGKLKYFSKICAAFGLSSKDLPGVPSSKIFEGRDHIAWGNHNPFRPNEIVIGAHVVAEVILQHLGGEPGLWGGIGTRLRKACDEIERLSGLMTGVVEG